MTEHKGFNSNAYWWTRLKAPNTLRPYLRIAEGLKIPMPLRVRDYDYDPNAKPTPPGVTHADTQHVSRYPYLKDTKTWPHAPRVENPRPHVPLFYKPWNAVHNITRARDMIAEHLAKNELSLQWYIKDCDLLEEKVAESKTSIYDWNEWKNAYSSVQKQYGATSWKTYCKEPVSDTSSSWWKDPDMRTAWQSKTVAAMRERSAALRDQDAAREQAEIIARLRSATSETPNDQIADLVNHLNKKSKTSEHDDRRLRAALAKSRYEARCAAYAMDLRAPPLDVSVMPGVRDCGSSEKTESSTPRHSLMEIEDHNMSDAYEHIKSLDSDDDRDVSRVSISIDSDEPGHYEAEGDASSNDSRHFDREPRAAQTWIDRFEELRDPVAARAERYAAWQKRVDDAIDESESSMM